MTHIVGDQDHVRRLGLRQIADAPRIDVDDLAAVLELNVLMREGRDGDIAVGISDSPADHLRQGYGGQQARRRKRNDDDKPLHGSL
jgi:hypothetical protein